MMLAGGSGKEAVGDLVGRMIASKIPNEYGKEVAQKMAETAVNTIPFEFSSCKN
uniref:hypothetical protein n=1 Tax=Altererythrobacter segetis TaxID=1104773 RepID=UPI00140B9ACA|nr:hypothetical protein [Altererythrobacter segetis]